MTRRPPLTPRGARENWFLVALIFEPQRIHRFAAQTSGKPFDRRGNSAGAGRGLVPIVPPFVRNSVLEGQVLTRVTTWWLPEIRKRKRGRPKIGRSNGRYRTCRSLHSNPPPAGVVLAQNFHVREVEMQQLHLRFDLAKPQTVVPDSNPFLIQNEKAPVLQVGTFRQNK